MGDGANGITVRPLSGAMGAEVTDVDLSGRLDNEAADAIRRAFLDHIAIFIPVKDLKAARMADLVARFGEPLVHPYLKPVEGEMRLKGRNIHEPGPDRVMVFQEFDQLLPWKTVKQNITFALRNGGRCSSTAEADDIAMEYIKKVKLDRFENTFPHMLSGGMKQRVAIARGMAMEPDILLMDEPFAALDALTRRQMQEELLQLWEDTHFTVLFVTHSIEEAIIIGSRILVLSPHPGQVKAELNAHQLGHGDVGNDAFSALQKRIHDMLFADRILEDELEAEEA